MKLKVLFILPVLVVNALWWAPLAIAVTPAPVGGGELGTDQQAKIDALKVEVEKLKIEVTDLEIELNLKENELSIIKTEVDNAYKANSSGKVYMNSVSKLLDAVNAKDKAQLDLNNKKGELKVKEDQLALLQSNTGTDSQGLSNYQKGGTILPDTVYQEMSDCEAIMRYVDSHPVEMEKAISDRQAEISGPSSADFDYNPSYTDILGCAVKTGDIKLWMVPYFARYILEFIIGIAGLASVAGVVYGGYLYLFAGLSDDQQKGKNAIKNSIIALVLTLSAWAIVNIVISVVTAI